MKKLLAIFGALIAIGMVFAFTNVDDNITGKYINNVCEENCLYKDSSNCSHTINCTHENCKCEENCHGGDYCEENCYRHCYRYAHCFCCR
ncbi:hypothetical protein [Methanocaldococcus sp.]